MAVKYQPSLDIIEDVTSEDYESSAYNGRKTNKRTMKSEDLRSYRISTEKSQKKSYNKRREIDNIFTQPSFNRKKSQKKSNQISGSQVGRTNDGVFLT